MQINIALNIFRDSAVGGSGVGGAGYLEELNPSLLLDFIYGSGGTLGDSEDQTLDLNFTLGSYQTATTTDPAYSYGRYLIAG